VTEAGAAEILAFVADHSRGDDDPGAGKSLENRRIVFATSSRSAGSKTSSSPSKNTRTRPFPAVREVRSGQADRRQWTLMQEVQKAVDMIALAAWA